MKQKSLETLHQKFQKYNERLMKSFPGFQPFVLSPSVLPFSILPPSTTPTTNISSEKTFASAISSNFNSQI